jgi:hypothetical protein
MLLGLGAVWEELSCYGTLCVVVSVRLSPLVPAFAVQSSYLSLPHPRRPAASATSHFSLLTSTVTTRSCTQNHDVFSSLSPLQYLTAVVAPHHPCFVPATTSRLPRVVVLRTRRTFAFLTLFTERFASCAACCVNSSKSASYLKCIEWMGLTTLTRGNNHGTVSA